MTTRFGAPLLAAACLLAALPSPSSAQAKPTRIYVSVVDADGKPATGLTVHDFAVREDNVAREVLSVAPASEPLSVALLIDDSQAANGQALLIRDGAKAFVKALAGKGDISIVTFGDRPTIVTGYTPDQPQLVKAIEHIFPRPGAGAYFMDAILDVCKGFEKTTPVRPVIAAIMIENDTEFSNAYYKQVLDRLYGSNASLNVVAVGQPAAPTTDALRNRNEVLSEGTQGTGGRRDQVLAQTAIPGAMRALADDLHARVRGHVRPARRAHPARKGAGHRHASGAHGAGAHQGPRQMIRRLVLAAVLASGGMAAVVLAQQFRLGVELVSLTVTVTDPDRPVRHRHEPERLRGVRGRRAAERHLLLEVAAADRARAPLDTSASMEERMAIAQEAADRVREAAAARPTTARSSTSTARYASFRRSPRRGRARERAIRGDHRQRVHVAVQCHLHLPQGTEEGAGRIDVGHPAPGDRAALGRRRHVEPGRLR